MEHRIDDAGEICNCKNSNANSWAYLQMWQISSLASADSRQLHARTGITLAIKFPPCVLMHVCVPLFFIHCWYFEPKKKIRYIQAYAQTQAAC